MKVQKQPEAKLVIIGDVGVGKTSLTVQYIHNRFDTKMESTLGAAYMQKTHQIKQNHNKYIKLKIWDTAGQEKYKAIAKLYYKDCQGALFVYDVTRQQSFNNVQNWADELTKHAPKGIFIGLVGNKIDLIDTLSQNDNQITTKEQSEQMAKSINASVNEQVSAKNQNSVQELFEKVAKSILEQIENKTAALLMKQKSAVEENVVKLDAEQKAFQI